MPTCTYNPKFKHVPREKLEVGKTYVCGDEEHKEGPCWRKNGEVIPLVLKLMSNDYYFSRETLTGDYPDSDRCNCSDLDHLYLYEETPTNNENEPLVFRVNGGARYGYTGINAGPSYDTAGQNILLNKTPMHKLSNLKAGNLLKTKDNYYRRAISDVMYPELEESATVFVSSLSKDKLSPGLKRAGGIFTFFELEENGYSIVSEKPTREEILAKLTQEERDIIEGK